MCFVDVIPLQTGERERETLGEEVQCFGEVMFTSSRFSKG